MKKATLVFAFFLFLSSLGAQIIAGPMLGQVEIREAKVWLEVSPAVKSIQLVYHKKGEAAKTNSINYNGSLGQQFNPVHFSIGGLTMATTYQYRFIVNGKPVKQSGEFTTKDLWQWRKPAPDFSFITGSCSYFNQPEYDRPGKPYGGDSAIFETMGNEKAAFMLWLGDNWYTREVDFYSPWGLWYRAQYDRSRQVVQNLLKRMPNYATWDDHDFGPNDVGGFYTLKEESKKVFDAYWANPSSGSKGEGIYTQISYADVDIFLTDDRWWRASDRLPDSVNGKPNPEKTMLGAQQMKWLKNSLLFSDATFKIIVIGNQVLNEVRTVNKLRNFPSDYYELMGFLAESKMEGVLFLSGDRHHTEILKLERPGLYPLFDLTISPLTSGTHKFSAAERNNSLRILGLDEKQNYGRLHFSGPKGQRKMQVEFIGVKGEKLAEWSVMESALKRPSK